jgi:hypothetical protein
MWFKTRIGLVSINAPVEILVVKDAKRNLWTIHATRPVAPRFTLKGLLGNPSPMLISYLTVLAIFSDGPDVSKSIAECMEQIEAAIRTNAEFCDLTRFGDLQAWNKRNANWQPIQWMRESTSPK